MLQTDTELMDTAHSPVHSWALAAAQPRARSRGYSRVHTRAQQPNRAWQRHWEPEQQEPWKNPPQCPGQADRQWKNRASCPQRATALGHPPRLPHLLVVQLLPGRGLRFGPRLRAGLPPVRRRWTYPECFADPDRLAGLAGLAAQAELAQALDQALHRPQVRGIPQRFLLHWAQRKKRTSVRRRKKSHWHIHAWHAPFPSGPILPVLAGPVYEKTYGEGRKKSLGV